MRVSKSMQNAAATVTFPPYLLARRLVHRGARDSASWVISGHSGTMYADNAAALHELLLQEGRDVTWISADDGITQTLRGRGAKVLRRNSYAARRAIERAAVLAYSHGPSDLDHLLVRRCALPGLRVHLNHCMSHLKAWAPRTLTALPESFVRAPVSDEFDYMLASSERERSNLQRSFVGAGSRIRLGGGAHLDAFMRARREEPARSLCYFPTFRDTREGKLRLDATVRALAANTRLHRWLAAEDYVLHVVGHVNSASGRTHRAESERVRFLPAGDLGDVIMRASALISDYSGVICDFLALERPVVFFPYDKRDYLKTRKLYVEYDDFLFGPEVDHVERLVDVLVSGAYRDLSAFAERRQRWQREFFPTWEPRYAKSTLEAIDALLQHDRAARAR